MKKDNKYSFIDNNIDNNNNKNNNNNSKNLIIHSDLSQKLLSRKKIKIDIITDKDKASLK